MQINSRNFVLKKLSTTIGIAFSILISGCATSYSLDGERYEIKGEFQAAADSKIAVALKNIQPYPAPLTERSLVFAIPSASTLTRAATERFVVLQKVQPIGPAKEILENIPTVNYKMTRVYGEAAAKRGIYKSVRIIDLDTLSASLQPSGNEDVLYYIEPSANSGQFFYATAKHGRQVFAFDKSQPGVSGKITGFLDALQAQAIRD